MTVKLINEIVFIFCSYSIVRFTKEFTESVFIVESGSNFKEIYTYSEFFLLDISGLRLLLWLRQAVIVNNSLKDFTNNSFLISILL